MKQAVAGFATTLAFYVAPSAIQMEQYARTATYTFSAIAGFFTMLIVVRRWWRGEPVKTIAEQMEEGIREIDE